MSEIEEAVIDLFIDGHSRYDIADILDISEDDVTTILCLSELICQ